MINYEVYNGQDINGTNGAEFMARNRHLTGTVYLFKDQVGRVTSVEAKSILSNIYKIDYSLNDVEFIAEYEKAINKGE